jgi:excisionase family DNA binding protein
MALPNKSAARENQLPSRKNAPPTRTAIPYRSLLPSPANSNDSAEASGEALVKVLSAIVRSALAPEIDRLFDLLAAEPKVPDYRDRHAEAQRLDISLSTLDRLCRDGLPFLHVGDSRRFRAADVDAWLDQRSKGATP